VSGYDDSYWTEKGVRALVEDFMAVTPADQVLITADTCSDAALVSSVLDCVRRVGAKGMVATLAQVPYQGALADPYLPGLLEGAVRQCTVWLDFTFPYLAGCHIHDEAMKAGNCRYLLGGDMSAQGAARLFGRVDLDDYFAASAVFDQLISQSVNKRVRITDPYGTDVSFDLAEPGLAKLRRAAKPGVYVAPGTCAFFPKLESVRGRIVLKAVFHEHYTSLEDSLAIEVDGRIQSVAGAPKDRITLDRALRRAGGGRYGYVIHFTYGLSPAARLTGGSFIEDAREMGNNAVGMGMPWWEPGGGENHPDGVLRRQSIWIENEQIVDDGVIVGPPALREAAARLLPLV